MFFGQDVVSSCLFARGFIVPNKPRKLNLPAATLWNRTPYYTIDHTKAKKRDQN
ncbi:hypothetical protein PISMIDRAFT_688954 [Pisolithus microcarpus 441]|uniref:Uncharacterized protein n=1 Tax=Pisolithus microcarpus 441 TaxID=765257 RepID=A0A0C9Y898_9AGAM|nr:hypothetical protein PISMIDRAFT_688954 [Pisolithus microcarpus 441]